MGERFRWAAIVCGVLLVLCAAFRAGLRGSDTPSAPLSPSATEPRPLSASPSGLAELLSRAGEDPSLTLCLGYYDAKGKFLYLEITPGVELDSETGGAVVPIRSIPDGAAKMRVFLLDEELRPLADVTEGDFPP